MRIIIGQPLRFVILRPIHFFPKVVGPVKETKRPLRNLLPGPRKIYLGSSTPTAPVRYTTQFNCKEDTMADPAVSGSEFKKQLHAGQPKMGLFLNAHSPTVA